MEAGLLRYWIVEQKKEQENHYMTLVSNKARSSSKSTRSGDRCESERSPSSLREVQSMVTLRRKIHSVVLAMNTHSTASISQHLQMSYSYQDPEMRRGRALYAKIPTLRLNWHFITNQKLGTKLCLVAC
jgi:hypothetical protein